jgi:soluble lytic murein transglycosylase-like protein
MWTPLVGLLFNKLQNKDIIMKILLALAFMLLTTSQFQTISYANISDRDELYAIILSSPQKSDKVIARNSRDKRSKSINNSQNSEVASGGLRAMVNQIARQHGVPTHIAHGVVMAESRYNCNAYNRSGASGIMQVLPNTARSVGVHGSLRNCANGLNAGMKYLKLALNKGGYGCSGVSLYERGIYARPGCTAYGRKVMAHAHRS